MKFRIVSGALFSVWKQWKSTVKWPNPATVTQLPLAVLRVESQVSVCERKKNRRTDGKNRAYGEHFYWWFYSKISCFP